MFNLLTADPGTYASITSGLGSAFKDLVSNTVTMAGVVLPIGISIFGMYMLIGFAKKLFSKITGK